MWRAAVIALLIGFPGFTQTIDPNAAKELALGKRLAAEFLRHASPITNPAVQGYLDAVGGRLAAAIAGDIRFTFAAVNEDPCSTTHEPAALPGGFVFVPAGLFLASQNEDEFAAMLAHAMEHSARRPAARDISAAFLGGPQGLCSAAAPAGFRAPQQRYELEADTLAIESMAHAGFDPGAMVQYIEWVQPPSARRDGENFLHPLAERVAAMEAALGQFGPTARKPATPDGFLRAQRELRAASQTRPREEKPPSLLRGN